MSKPISLKVSEAACLEALRSGIERKALIAVRAVLNLRQTGLALGTLASLELATINGNRTWHLTPRGKTANVSIAPDVRKRGRPPGAPLVPGPSATRMLALLHRPRRGAELAALLGVTRQRVHQLIVALSARGLVRSADPDHPTFVIALKDDASPLLRQDQERVLSAFPETKATTLSKIALAAQMHAGKTATIAESLRKAGLIEKAGAATHRDLYRLTALGSTHWQRSATARHAEMPPPPFRSDRVRTVLSYLQSQGAARTRDVGLTLGIPQPSINALMQYLKRRNAVRTRTDARRAPYELTPDGLEMLDAMTTPARVPDPLSSAGTPAGHGTPRATREVPAWPRTSAVQGERGAQPPLHSHPPP
jgi:DNA-binding MarR family transcriptional regulator